MAVSSIPLTANDSSICRKIADSSLNGIRRAFVNGVKNEGTIADAWLGKPYKEVRYSVRKNRKALKFLIRF